jgi:metal-responsive CopG/Arc/MetJ family transcriptional regulator
MEKSLGGKIIVRVNEDDLKEIDQLAKQLGIDRSRMIRNMLSTALDDMRIMRKVGVFSLVRFIREKQIRPEEIISLTDDMEVA